MKVFRDSGKKNENENKQFEHRNIKHLSVVTPSLESLWRQPNIIALFRRGVDFTSDAAWSWSPSNPDPDELFQNFYVLKSLISCLFSLHITHHFDGIFDIQVLAPTTMTSDREHS